MDEGSYRVIITGELLEGFLVSEVVERLASLFKQPTDTIDRRFGRDPIPLNAALSAAHAEKVREQLQRIGVVTRIEPVPESVTPNRALKSDKQNRIGPTAKERIGITSAVVLAVLSLTFIYLSLSGSPGAMSALADIEVVDRAENDGAVKKLAVYAKDSLPEAVVDTPQGTATFLKINVLCIGIKLAAREPASGIVPGMDLDTLGHLLTVPDEALKDGWGTRLRVSIGENGVVVASLGPDGILGSGDDLVMYRRTH